MENPYKLKEGETLTLQQLLDRYLDWLLWKVDKDRELQGSCDRELWYISDCCDLHRAMATEFKEFYVQFRKLWVIAGFSDDDKRTFSVALLKYMVVTAGLKIDSRKVEKYWGMRPGEWKTVIPLSPYGTPLHKKVLNSN